MASKVVSILFIAASKCYDSRHRGFWGALPKGVC
jgi:hypothetical protein